MKKTTIKTQYALPKTHRPVSATQQKYLEGLYKTKFSSLSDDEEKQSPEKTQTKKSPKATFDLTARENELLKEKASTEQMYITNLENQLKFVEMELEMQKKIAVDAKDTVLRSSRPLDQTLEEIKINFVQKAREFEPHIEQLERENNEKAQVISSMEFEKQQMKKSFAEERESLIADWKKKQEEYLKRMILAENRQEVLQKKEIPALERNVASLTQQNAKHLQEVTELQKDLEVLKQAKENLSIENEQKSKSITKLNEEISKLKTNVSTNEGKDKKHKEKKKVLLAQIEEEKDKRMQAELFTKKLEVEKNQLEAKLQKTSNMLENSIQKNLELENESKSFKDKNNSLKNSLDKVNKEMEELGKQMQSMQFEKNNQENEKSNLRREIKQNNEVRMLTATQKDDFALQLKEKQNENTSLQSQLVASQEFIKELTELNEKLKLKNETQQGDLQTLAARNSVYEQQNKKLSSDLFKATKALEIMKKKEKIAGLLGNLKEFSNSVKESEGIIKSLGISIPSLTSFVEKTDKDDDNSDSS